MIDKIYVAKIGKTVGLKGHLKLFIDSDFPEQFKKNAIFTTNKKLELKVQEYNISREVIKFQNYDNIDEAKKLINQELFVSEEQTKQNCKLADEEYFWFDLMGCEIIENEVILGKIKDIHRYPLNDYFEVSTDLELVKKDLSKTFLIPYLFEKYIVSVNISNKTIETKNCYEILENS